MNETSFILTGSVAVVLGDAARIGGAFSPPLADAGADVASSGPALLPGQGACAKFALTLQGVAIANPGKFRQPQRCFGQRGLSVVWWRGTFLTAGS